MATKKNNTKKDFTMSREEYIEFLSMKSNEIHMSTKNSKTGCGVIDLAFPVVTCREDAPCKKSGKCYCMKGTQQMTTVLGAYYRNLRLYTNDPEDFWHQVWFKLAHCGLPKMRYFDAGDLPDYAFIDGMVETAKKFPEMKFMAFTKKYFLVNQWIDNNGELPANLNIIFSAWDKNWEILNPHHMPVAYVEFKESGLTPELPEKYNTCPNQKDKLVTCSACGKCWRKDLGTVVFKQH